MREYRREAHLTATVIESILLPELRKSYTLQASNESFQFESEVYQTESKGLFGLGPKWQEKISFTLVIMPTRRIQHMSASGKPIGLAQIGYVRLTSAVMERQNSSFTWQRKEGDPFQADQIRRAIESVDQAVRLASFQSGDIRDELVD